MACPEITTIPSSECIGNSLITINSNFDTLKNAICDISVNETGIAIEDEGNPIGINIGTVNFIGAGVNTIVQGNRAQVNAVYSITAMDALLGDKADTSALASKLEAADISGKLDTSVHDARVTAENQFYNAMIESLYLESSVGSGTEFDYTGLVGF